ncbi:AMP-binding protein [Methylobacterium sp. J-026]|uniref:AMP-binding protein n=1 Tax=Methylobacterium sp. J-026 TaxID=2836624 RepID=UPI001FBA197C|nr:AMP-binding protein [Methylobacterium sp. J-026]MCJ2134207.1 AMP-binding protein [Methylobacterium sp. J-026]
MRLKRWVASLLGARDRSASRGDTADPGPAFDLKLCDFTFVSEDGSRTMPAVELRRLAEAAALRFRQDLTGQRIGLVFRSEPALIVAWLGLVSAGFEPLILQYPTEKQDRAAWRASVANSVTLATLDHVVCAPEIADLLPDLAVPFGIDHLPEGSGVGQRFAFRARAILQLSSGTTGHRKALAFTRSQVEAHVGAYNAIMRLRSDDVCVSWLPLYHDMGFVACFLMPLVLGVPVVMIDPITWVRRPKLLFDAIAAHRGTYCYMPNFGFEIMARQPAGDLGSMRRWVSCSEPVYAETAERFLAAHTLDPSTFASCYAMAENVFAVAQSDALSIVEHDGRRLVSCGAPIPGVELEIRDGQIFVTSPTAMRRYLGGAEIADARGFYPTGDAGFLHGGALIVTGRTGDVLNIAGRKYMLNDLDRAVETLVPESRGRAVVCAERSDELGTELPIAFIEDETFFARTDAGALQRKLSDLTGIEVVQIHFVPSRFIVKTSSGKANRRATLERWKAHVTHVRSSRRTSLADDFDALFPHVPRDEPVADCLDSLGRVLISIIASHHGRAIDTRRSINEILASDAAAEADSAEDGIRIVALCDRGIVEGISPETLEHWSALLGCPVSLEHVCVPPSEVLLNDLIVCDYFRTDGTGESLDMVDEVLAIVKGASLLLVDDVAEIAFAKEQVYPLLNRMNIREAGTEMLAYRWQRYTLKHHLLPISVQFGQDLSDDHDTSLDRLAGYLGADVLKIATLPIFTDLTRQWDVIDRVNHRHDNVVYAPPSLGLADRGGPAARSAAQASDLPRAADPDRPAAFLLLANGQGSRRRGFGCV